MFWGPTVASRSTGEAASSGGVGTGHDPVVSVSRPLKVSSSVSASALSDDGPCPIWMLNTRKPDFKPNDEHHGHWVYAVFYIKVGE